MSEKLYNVWADLKDGKGVRKINAKPLSREKALAEVNRLVYGRCKAQRAYALEASNAVRQGVPISA